MRVPQEERTRAMRARLLEATVDCLVESRLQPVRRPPWSRERAGVSRGAQLHHFPTKNDLVVAAVAHLTEVRGAEAGRPPQRALPDWARGVPGRCCSMLGDHFTSPVFTAALGVAGSPPARDPALMAEVEPLEQRVGREAHRLTVEALGA